MGWSLQRSRVNIDDGQSDDYASSPADGVYLIAQWLAALRGIITGLWVRCMYSNDEEPNIGIKEQSRSR